MIHKRDGFDLQRVGQSRYLFVEGAQQAGNGKAYFKREGWIGFGKFFPDGRPGRQIEPFGKGLLLKPELFVGGIEHLLFESCGCGGVYDLLVSELDDGGGHAMKFKWENEDRAGITRLRLSAGCRYSRWRCRP